MGGIENEVTYRFFLGFKLIKGEEEVSVKKVKEDILAVFTDLSLIHIFMELYL